MNTTEELIRGLSELVTKWQNQLDAQNTINLEDETDDEEGENE